MILRSSPLLLRGPKWGPLGLGGTKWSPNGMVPQKLQAVVTPASNW